MANCSAIESAHFLCLIAAEEGHDEQPCGSVPVGCFIDIFSGVTPELVRPQQQGVTAAVLAAGVYTLIAMHFKGSESFFPATLIAVLVSFIFRVFAVREHWPSMVPRDTPTGSRL